MPRIVAILGIILIALSSCALPIAVHADEPSATQSGLTGAARATRIKEFSEGFRAAAPDESKAEVAKWIVEDTTDDFMGGPVVKIIVPDSHYCLFAVSPYPKSDRSIGLGCAPLEAHEKRRGA